MKRPKGFIIQISLLSNIKYQIWMLMIFQYSRSKLCSSYGRFKIPSSLKLSWPCRPPGDKVFNFFFWFWKTKRWCREQHENVGTSNLINDAQRNLENHNQIIKLSFRINPGMQLLTQPKLLLNIVQSWHLHW